MNNRKHFGSLIAFSLITLLFSLFTFNKINSRLNDGDQCLCSNDGFGYYIYLPSVINNSEIEIDKEYAQDLQNQYCDSNFVYQLVESKTGKTIDIYHMGLSFIKLPSYLIAHFIAAYTKHPQDGFSAPYFIAHHINGLLFLILGLYYLRRLLLLYVNDWVTAISIILTYLATNIYATFSIQVDLPHLYLFSLNAIFIYHLIRYSQDYLNKDLVICLFVFGLGTVIRPTQAVFGIIPFILLSKQLRFTSRFWKTIVLFPIISIVLNIPQFIYWKYIGGEWIIPNLHTEDIVLTDPKTIEFLFSYRKGWLLYTPIFILLIPGFVNTYKNYKPIFWSIFSFTLLYIWILSSWECWWYAGSFGSRVMTDIYPFLILIIAIGLSFTKSKIMQSLILTFSCLCLILNVFQTTQLTSGIIDSARMSKEHYFYTFGESQINNFTNARLLMDRNDQGWINEIEALNIEKQTFVTKEIFSLTNKLIAKPGEDLTIGRYTILDKVPNDETQLTVNFSTRTSNPRISSILRMESISKYNCYSWNSSEVSIGSTKNEITNHQLVFNLPDIRHRNDEMQLYIDNDHDVEIELLSFTIKAKTLIRE